MKLKKIGNTGIENLARSNKASVGMRMNEFFKTKLIQ
jgi:hypothetical protein